MYNVLFFFFLNLNICYVLYVSFVNTILAHAIWNSFIFQFIKKTKQKKHCIIIIIIIISYQRFELEREKKLIMLHISPYRSRQRLGHLGRT